MKSKLVLVSIFFLALFLRFYKLGSIPALNADEAALGYNAYSLIKTGLDEHGNSWPLHFQSFNDFKPGLLVYLILPFIKIFGLNIWAVRFFPTLLSTLTVLSIYFLTKEIYRNNQATSYKLPATIASLLLAISPWHIHFSRGAWEVSVTTFFITTGLWLFLKSLSSPKYFGFSAFSFVLSLYTYHAARLIVPLLGIFLIIYYNKKLLKHIKTLSVVSIISIILLLPLGLSLFGEAGLSRAAGVGLFSDPGPISRINEQRGEHANFNSITPKIFHNKLTNYSLAFLQNWGEHYWGEFLFLSGDEIQRNRVPETGQLYTIEIIFVLLGLYFILKNPKKWGIILFWLIIAPTAAALTFQSPHALRAHNMVIPLTIISAYGLTKIITFFQKFFTRKIFLYTSYYILATLIIWSFSRYQLMYWFHLAKEYPFSSQYGFQQMVEFVNTTDTPHEKVLITDRYDQPYILVLFYSKYDPAKFQSEHTLSPRDKFGFSTVPKFGKYEFRLIRFDEESPKTKNALIIGTDGEIPDEANIISEIYGQNGYKYFDIVAN